MLITVYAWFVKVVAYLRVSTDRQAEEGLGLEVQEQAIRRWAKAAGHRVTQWRSDEGQPGSNGLDTRVGLGEALEDVRRGDAKALVVYRLDRLARDQMLQEYLLHEVWSLGGDVLSTAGSEQNLRDDPEDPGRKLMRRIFGAVAEYERDMIRLRTQAGRRRKADRGGYAYGAPPFGYRAESGELVPVDGEQAVIARIVAWRDDGVSLARSAAILNAEGVPARKGRWHPTTVARVLARLDRQVIESVLALGNQGSR